MTEFLSAVGKRGDCVSQLPKVFRAEGGKVQKTRGQNEA